MAGELKMVLQRLANHWGYQIIRRDLGVDLTDPYAEQQRILGKDIRMVLEVGAFDGRDSLRYTELFPQAKVHAFEPVPESFAQLRENSAQCDRIRAHNLALSDVSGRATFHLSNWIDASSLLKPQATGCSFDAYQASSRSIDVQVDTLDAVCEREGIGHINLLKMDAQGAELKILDGSRRMLASNSIDMVFSEIHFLQSYEGAARFDQIMQRMVEAGFQFHTFYGLNHNHKGQTTWGDALFVHHRLSY